MGLRDTIQNNPAIGLVIAIVIIGAAIALIMRGTAGQNRRGQPSSGIYFYDLESGDVVVKPSGTLAPASLASGAQGVRAHIYTCGNCANEADRMILFISKLSEKAMKIAESRTDDPDDAGVLAAQIEQGRLLAAVPEAGATPQWIAAQSEAGQALSSLWSKKCDGKFARVCSPRE